MKKTIKIFLITIATIAIITTMCVFASENIIYIKDGENIISSSESSSSGSFLTLKNLETKKVNVVLNSEVELLDDFEMKIEQTTGNTKIVFSKSTKELLITPSKAGTESVIVVFENNKTNSKYVLPITMNILAETKNVTLRSNIESLGVTQNANTLIGVANITKQIEEKNEKITELPKINLVSEDLKSNIPLNVTKITENKYKFEGSISEIKENIKYNIITTLENEGETAESKIITSKSIFLDTVKSEYSNETVILKTGEDKLIFTKKQAKDMSVKLNDLKLFLTDTKLEYISGNIIVNNEKGNINIYFLGENGEKVDTWHIKKDDGNYYFDRTISGFEKNKKYNLVIEAENGKKIVDLWNKKERVGKYNVEIFDSKLQATEEIKKIDGKLKSLNIFVSGTNLEYMSGNVEVRDTKGKVSIYFLGENGERVDTWYVKNNDGSYYFDRTISGFENGKKYNLVIEAENGKKIVDLWNKKENVGKYNVEIFDSKINVIEYIKKIDGKLKSLNIFVSGNNLEYLSGNIEVRDAKGNVSIYFLGENGERVDTWHVKNDDGSYYFDRTIGGFEKNKKYSLVIEAENGKKIVDLWNKKEKIGKYNIEIINSKIQINENEEIKNMFAKLKSLNIFVSGNNLEYISGDIEIKDAKGNVSIYFLGENGERVDTWHIKKDDGNYYFDRTISGFEKNKKYNLVIEAENGKKIVDLWNKKERVGKYNVEIFDSKLQATEEIKKIDGKLKSLNIFVSGTNLEYMSGNVEVRDTKGKVSIYFLGENGERVDTWYVKNNDGSYYFDRTISGFENGKKYNLVIEAENGKKIVDLWNKKENVGKYNVEIFDSKINVIEYIKKIDGKLKSLNIFVSGNNLEYLSGNIEVRDAKGNVSIYFLGENGERVDTWHVKNDDGSYYFDRTISGFENDKKYSLVIEAENGKKIVDLWNKKEKIGKYNVEISNSKIQAIKEAKDIENNDIKLELKDFKLFMANGKTEYLSGIINIKNAKGNVKIIFYGPNGKTADVWTVKKDDENYYFDRTISGFEKGITYQLVLEAENGAKKVELKDANTKIGNYNVIITDSKLISK